MEKRLLHALFCVLASTTFDLFADSTPTMSRVYGNQYTPQTDQTQDAGLIGQLVPTGVFGTNGSLSLSAQVPNAQAVATQVLSNGIIVVAFHNGTNTYLVEYNAEGLVNEDFAAGTGNILTLSHLAQPGLFITVDAQQRLILAGANDNSGLPWIERVMPDGTIDNEFSFVDGTSWTSSGSINYVSLQSSGQLIAVGFNGTNLMLARYNLDGSLDASFGTDGYVIFDGSMSGTTALPTSPYATNIVYIDVANNIYIPFIDATPSVYVTRLNSVGLVDTNWNSGSPIALSYLDGSSMQTGQLTMIADAAGDLVVAVASGSPSVIKAASISMQAASTPGTFANFTTSGGVFGTDRFILYNMIADSNGFVYFLGSDLTSKKMAIIRCTSAGILDTSFNETGVNFFYPAGFEPSIYDILLSGSLAPDGQIFVAGAQLDLGITTPYISSLYNNQYAAQINQFPAAQEQGIIDIRFGSVATEVYNGIVSPFLGLYRASLQQKAETVIELQSGSLLAGINGYLGTSPLLSNMILVRMTSAGLLDGTFGSGGKLALANITGTNEYITSVLEDGSNNLYVTGYSDDGAIFRKYTSSGTLIWNSDYLVSGYQAQSCGFEGQTRVLLFLNGPSNTGQINAYLDVNGDVDTTFNDIGSHPGQLLTTEYSLDFGSVYNGTVGSSGSIYIAYKNTTTGQVDVSSIFDSGTGVDWTTTNVFSSTAIAANNIRVSFNADGNIAVAAGLGGSFLVTVLDALTGTPTSAYPTPLNIAGGTAIEVTQLIGVSDDTLLVVGYDTTDDVMLVARIAADGTLDTTFNSQGSFPGVAIIQIGDQISDYYARVASGIAIQSHVGANQGNVIVSAYEQLFSTDATPIIMRLFGAPGTTQVPNSSRPMHVPGTFDDTYGTGGIQETYVLGASTPAANQEVRSIRQLVGTQIMTVVTDNTTSISYLARLNSDGSMDTTFGSGLGIAIPKLDGTEVVQSLVFDGAGNFLITGWNSSNGGFIKRLLPSGVVDQTFGGYNGSSASLNYPVGTVYGLMDIVNACQQLTTGNIVIVGSVSDVGTIQMLTATGTNVTSFGTTGSVSNGLNITSVSVDPSDNIYVSVAYQDGSAINARILKLNSTGQTTIFDIAPALSNIDNITGLRLVFGHELFPIIAASVGGSAGQVVMNRFTADGAVDTTFNSGSALTISFADEVTPTNVAVTGLVALQDAKILVSGYLLDTITPANNYEFIAGVRALGELDGSFGDGVTPGLVTFQALGGVQLARYLTDMNIQNDGKILMSGGEVPALNEETPLTMRMTGFVNVQAVPQFTGYQATIPNVLDPDFNGNGISYVDPIANLDQIGNIVVDGDQRPVVAGVTSDGFFKLVRYRTDGAIDTTFGTDGIARTTVPFSGLTGGYLAIDGAAKILVGGVAGDSRFVVARFNIDGTLDTSFSGGVATSTVITNLHAGGFITANIVTGADFVNYPVVAGHTSDGNIVAVRFNNSGSQDSSFGSSGVVTTVVASLVTGGSIISDLNSSIYIGGRLSDNSMFVAKYTKFGLLDPSYGPGDDGFASTGVIPYGLLDGGSVDLDGNNNIVIGGLTPNYSFVAARFTTGGDLDPLFAGTGIAYSSSVNVLDLFGNITVDSQNRVVLGGVASNHDGSKSMIVGRFTQVGLLDTGFTSTGIASTGPLADLLSGGVIATDAFANIFSGGLTDIPGFVVTQMYGGDQIFVTNPSLLNPHDFKTYHYGNSPDYLTKVLSADFFARVIQDQGARAATLLAIANVVADYVLVYLHQSGFNLVWALYLWNSNFAIAQQILTDTYTGTTGEQINSCFATLSARIEGMKYSS